MASQLSVLAADDTGAEDDSGSGAAGAANAQGAHMPFAESFLLPNLSNHLEFFGDQGSTSGKGGANASPPDNGCGTAATDWLVPDKVFGIDLGPACRAHDQCYDAGSVVPRAECDARLGADVKAACIDAGSAPLLCAALGGVYQAGVWIFGAAAYQGNPPPTVAIVPMLAQIPEFHQF